MMLYGGLIPSRLHHLNDEVSERMIEKLTHLKKRNPDLVLYASSVVLRAPRYNSNDEEPDYYQTYGSNLFFRKYLEDKERRVGLTEDEKAEYTEAVNHLPDWVVADYEQRRAFNLKVNKAMIKLVKLNIIDFLVIPQDDSAEYGYTAIDQKVVSQEIQANHLERQILVYPGSDEVGATLVARMYNMLTNQQPKLYIEWSSTLGPTLIPNYEDRPMNETLKKHVLAVGASIVDTLSEADALLAYNVPGKVMQESWDQWTDKDQTYNSFRDLITFYNKMEEAIQSGKKVALVDSAYSNGGDGDILNLLIHEELFLKLTSYKGWNTNANSLGTSLAQLCIADHKNEEVKQNLMYHLLDDFIYQSLIRQEIDETYLPLKGLSYGDLKNQSEWVSQIIGKEIHTRFKKEFPSLSKKVPLQKVDVYIPWNRLFEIELMLE